MNPITYPGATFTVIPSDLLTLHSAGDVIVLRFDRPVSLQFTYEGRRYVLRREEATVDGEVRPDTGTLEGNPYWEVHDLAREVFGDAWVLALRHYASIDRTLRAFYPEAL